MQNIIETTYTILQNQFKDPSILITDVLRDPSDAIILYGDYILKGLEKVDTASYKKYTDKLQLLEAFKEQKIYSNVIFEALQSGLDEAHKLPSRHFYYKALYNGSWIGSRT